MSATSARAPGVLPHLRIHLASAVFWGSCCLANFFANSGVQYWSTFSTAHTQQTIDRLYTDLDTVAARAEQ